MEPQELPSETLLGITYRIPFIKIPEDELGLSNINAQHSTVNDEKIKEFSSLLLKSKLTEKQAIEIAKLLVKHQSIFAKPPKQLARTHLIRHIIEILELMTWWTVSTVRDILQP